MQKLLLLTADNDAYLNELSQCDLPGLKILDDSPHQISEANIWVADPPLAAPLISGAKKLQWLQSTYAGVDALIPTFNRSNYQLTNVQGSFGPLMSEYVFGYLLSIYRNHQHYAGSQFKQVWSPVIDDKIAGKRILIIGAGSIGQHLASTAQHFDMEVIGVNQLGQARPHFDNIVPLAQLDNELPLADVVVSILPKTPQTKNLLNQSRLALLKADAILFNIGRGDAVDIDALANQLNQQPKQTAILDVFPYEPLTASHPLWQLDNAILTPHVAAPSFPKAVIEVFAENYLRWIENQSLNYLIDFEKGY
ncbi:D-2-hydroxyacid dehydrogenase [Parashewanella curva]|uniref:D-2-hydroxyacid dehydrogenase n=1 Tax=Parashewanella curva TaxID=2338552 RepID=A0A3L8PTD7_9GAMM|nr:D-2-hydroxyacid dehydrogenase [Parashewanella curva]RLV58544.1 D-2-hydroxyacid dehydrogenase [Parashewanella curva]